MTELRNSLNRSFLFSSRVLFFVANTYRSACSNVSLCVSIILCYNVSTCVLSGELSLVSDDGFILSRGGSET